MNYYQSSYFAFFFTLHILSAVHEILPQVLDAKNLCAYILVVARKAG